MAAQLTRRLKPEEEELHRKREELASVRASLAERELELADLRSQLAAFEGRYLRQVGALYAELDEWKARIAELRAKRDPSAANQQQAREARDEAGQTYEAAHGEASKARDFSPSPELKTLFREAAKRIHPDFANGPDDLARRTRFMAEANRAYEAGDVEALQRILNEFHDGDDTVQGEGIGAELVRIIRQISQARSRISAIDQEIATILKSEIAKLKQDADEAQKQGRDLIVELAARISDQITRAKRDYEALTMADR